MPNYLAITAERLGKGTPVMVRVVPTAQDLALDMAEAIYDEIESLQATGKNATLIVPVGPIDQFPILAALINERKLDCRRVMFINMDEYLNEDDQWIDENHPLSFRGYMERSFYRLLESSLAPDPSIRVFPDPHDPEAIARQIKQRGGVDATFGGIGINGHIAFNEPPEPGELVGVGAFAGMPTRCLTLSRETRTINSHTVGGDISVIPHRAITVGMCEILGSRKIRLYCNRPWQSAVIRQVLHGPIASTCPSSLIRTHPDAVVTLTKQVAMPPDIRLR
ncbi:MAG: glucosamine-6-phosphate isomerase [Phycisphaeraceae bacterium]|nr:glucosamine-6-phosphate isomerase [Phycisphaeraceae bacterium]